MFAPQKKRARKTRPKAAATESPSTSNRPPHQHADGQRTTQTQAPAFDGKKYLRELKRRTVDTTKDRRYTIGYAGLAGGLMTLTKGAGSACAAVVTNPLLIGLGVVIALASAGYLFWTYFT